LDALKQIEQQKLKQTRSKLVFDKYLSPYSKNAVQGIDRKIVDTLETKLELGNIPDVVFKPLQDQLFAMLQKLFLIFRESDLYYTTAQSLILPPKIRKELKLCTREELIKELSEKRKAKTDSSSSSSSSSTASTSTVSNTSDTTTP